MKLHNIELDVDFYLFDGSLLDDLKKFVAENEPERFFGNKKRMYSNNIFTFDIETTSYKTKELKLPFLYCWQSTIRIKGKEFNVFGRTLTEIRQFLEILKEVFIHKKDGVFNEKENLVMWVHNLSFEFSFLYMYFLKMWEDIFFTKNNVCLYAKLPNIEFRCSYLLSGVGLGKLPTTLKKLKGDLNYDLIRHDKTKMTDKEIAYCLNDVRVLAEYVEIVMKENDCNISNLPYTKTGFVRTDVREYCMGTDFHSSEKKAFLEILKEMQIKTVHEYTVLKNAYTGGHTSVNPEISGRIFTNVLCMDISSSYPTSFMSDRFPISLFAHEETMTQEQYEYLMSKKMAIVSKITFYNVKPKFDFDSYISVSNCSKEKNGFIEFFENFDKEQQNNGKVRYAKKLSIYCLEIDYEIIREFYDFETMEVEDAYIYQTGFMPAPVLKYALKLYKEKTMYKDREGCNEFGVPYETLYRLAKERLNSLYGMACSNPCRLRTFLNHMGEWTNEEDMIYDRYKREGKDFNDPVVMQAYQNEIFDVFMEKLKEGYNKKLVIGKNCIAYQWGIYISALSRLALMKMLKKCGLADCFLYSDTDSIFVRNPDKVKPFFDEYNKEMETKMNCLMKLLGLPQDEWKPKDVNGVEHPLGYFSEDKFCLRFKALRAKSYIYTVKNKKGEEELRITIAGLGKEKGRDFLVSKFQGNFDKIFAFFNDKMVVPPEETGKQTHQILYFTEPITQDVVDYNGEVSTITTYGGTFLEPAKFSLNQTDDYLKLIDELQGTQDSWQID